MQNAIVDIGMTMQVSVTDTGELWNMYESAFVEVNALAAQRHLMTGDEFASVMQDDRIEKWTARDDSGQPIGFGVQTTDLESWPLISPAYFRRRWPLLYDEHRIWYVGFVCTRQRPAAPLDTFPQIIIAMSERTRKAGGISVMDYCGVNVERGLPAGALRILQRARGTTAMQTVDAQHFHAYDFGNNGFGS